MLGLYILIINIITFLLFVIDKTKKRIDEKILLCFMYCGGFAGGKFAMTLSDRKTDK